MGHTTNKDIRIAKSVVDYIFRWLGITFLPGYREANRGLPVPAESQAANGTAAVDKSGSATPVEGTSQGNGKVDYDMLERAGVALKVDQNGGPMDERSEQYAQFQSDAPSCDNCGHITVRNGNCYLCHNCGNSMGCS